ncbi:MAG: hypothetical protein ABJA77_02865 [Variovorax sp.]
MTDLTLSQRTQQLPRLHPRALLLLAGLTWWALYQLLIPASESIVAALPVDRASHLGGALQFFLYDTPKVLLLLTAAVFVMGMINSYVMAVSLGIVTRVIALSLPEMILLRKVLKVRLIATFAGVVAAGILLVGYLFNAVL